MCIPCILLILPTTPPFTQFTTHVQGYMVKILRRIFFLFHSLPFPPSRSRMTSINISITADHIKRPVVSPLRECAKGRATSYFKISFW